MRHAVVVSTKTRRNRTQPTWSCNRLTLQNLSRLVVGHSLATPHRAQVRERRVLRPTSLTNRRERIQTIRLQQILLMWKFGKLLQRSCWMTAEQTITGLLKQLYLLPRFLSTQRSATKQTVWLLPRRSRTSASNRFTKRNCKKSSPLESSFFC